MSDKVSLCCGVRTEEDPTSLKYSKCTLSSILDRLMSCSGALSEKNLVFRKNSDKTLSWKHNLSLNQMCEVMEFELNLLAS
jgi:hypothetical protein